MHPTGTVPDLYVPILFNSRMDSDGSSDFITPSLQRDFSLTPWSLQKGIFITFIRKLMIRITVKLFWLLYSRMIGNYFPISSFNHWDPFPWKSSEPLAIAAPNQTQLYYPLSYRVPVRERGRIRVNRTNWSDTFNGRIHIYKDNIKMGLEKIKYNVMNWAYLALYRAQW